MGVLKVRTQGACKGEAGISINGISNSKKPLKSVAVADPVVQFQRRERLCSVLCRSLLNEALTVMRRSWEIDPPPAYSTNPTSTPGWSGLGQNWCIPAFPFPGVNPLSFSPPLLPAAARGRTGQHPSTNQGLGKWKLHKIAEFVPISSVMWCKETKRKFCLQ